VAEIFGSDRQLKERRTMENELEIKPKNYNA
jgi:hypothetical protein